MKENEWLESCKSVSGCRGWWEQTNWGRCNCEKCYIYEYLQGNMEFVEKYCKDNNETLEDIKERVKEKTGIEK